MSRQSTHHLYPRKVNRGGYIEILYYVRFVDWQNRRRVFPAGSDYQTAKKLRDELLARNVLRYDFDEMAKPKAAGIAFNKWLDDCLETKKHKRAIRNYQMAAPKLREYFGDHPIDSITSDEVESFKTWRYAQSTIYGPAPKPATVNRHLALLKFCMRRAFELGKIAKLPLVRLDEENNERNRLASDGELEKIYQSVPGFALEVITIMMEQGMRISEACGLLRGNVKLDENLIRLEASQTKNGKPREMPMTSTTRAIIIQAMDRKVAHVESRVFLDQDGQPLNRFKIYGYFKRACKKHGIENLTPHDLRATFSTRKTVDEGHDRKLVMAIIGDRTDKAFNRYLRPTLDDLKKVME